MFKKIINIFFLISFFTFIFLITKYYFSEKNLIFINKSRSSYSLTSIKDENNLETDSVFLLRGQEYKIKIKTKSYRVPIGSPIIWCCNDWRYERGREFSEKKFPKFSKFRCDQ